MGNTEQTNRSTASAVPIGRVRGHRDDRAERPVRTEVQLPPPHVPRHGLSVGDGGAQGRLHVRILIMRLRFSTNPYWSSVVEYTRKTWWCDW